MSKYMHTIDGRPATFDGFQICFASFHGKPNTLADSLSQIRKEQRITIKNRKARGFAASVGRYGHFRYE